jgi:hypothetical protein
MTELEKCQIAKERGFAYNAITGDIIGINGNPITKKNRFGYRVCSLKINRVRYYIYGHRLAWFLYYGELPKNTIDHVDGDKLNNKMSNLRDVTHQENLFNCVRAKGYSWDSVNKKYAARIKVNNLNIFLGRFDTEQEARNAYLKAKQKYHIIDKIYTQTKV